MIDKQAVKRALATIDWEQSQKRFLADVLASALPSQWDDRARTFEAARPKPDDYTGRASAQELSDLDARLAELAAGCRLHAAILRGDDLASPSLAADVALYDPDAWPSPLETVA